MAREALAQELHLIAENSAAVGEREILGVVRHVRQSEQLDGCFFQEVIALAMVTALAGRDHVVPGVVTTAGDWHDVISRELCIRERVAAIQACALVTRKQRLIG